MFPLLLISAWLNYIDRGTLSVAAPVLGPEFGLDPSRVGTLLSAFFWTYAGLQPFAGWIAERYPVKWVYAAGFAVWTLATLLTGFAGGFASLFACRALLGLGESVAYPCYSKIITTQMPEHRRGLANALIDAGTKGGPALGTYLGAVLIAEYGWRWYFIGIGALPLVWLLPWSRVRLNTHIASAAQDAAPTLGDLLRNPSFWGTSFGLFFFNYLFYFLLTWLPSYLVNERGLSLKSMGIVGALPWIATVFASIGFGIASDRWIGNGQSPRRLRPRVLIAGQLLCAAALPFTTLPNPGTAFVFLLVSFSGLGVATSNLWAFTQTLAGPALAGRWTGAQNGFGNLGGVVAPIVTGMLVQRTGNFYFAFVAAAVAVLISGACYTWVAIRSRY